MGQEEHEDPLSSFDLSNPTLRLIESLLLTLESDEECYAAAPAHSHCQYLSLLLSLSGLLEGSETCTLPGCSCHEN